MWETTTRGQNLITSQLFQMLIGGKWVTNTIPLERKIEVHATANVVGLSDPIRYHVVFDTSSWKVTQKYLLISYKIQDKNTINLCFTTPFKTKLVIPDDTQYVGTPKRAIPGFNYLKTDFPLNLFLQHLFVHKSPYCQCKPLRCQDIYVNFAVISGRKSCLYMAMHDLPIIFNYREPGKTIVAESIKHIRNMRKWVKTTHFPLRPTKIINI